MVTVCIYAPDQIATNCLTQPRLTALVIFRVGKGRPKVPLRLELTRRQSPLIADRLSWRLRARLRGHLSCIVGSGRRVRLRLGAPSTALQRSACSFWRDQDYRRPIDGTPNP